MKLCPPLILCLATAAARLGESDVEAPPSNGATGGSGCSWNEGSYEAFKGSMWFACSGGPVSFDHGKFDITYHGDSGGGDNFKITAGWSEVACSASYDDDGFVTMGSSVDASTHEFTNYMENTKWKNNYPCIKVQCNNWWTDCNLYYSLSMTEENTSEDVEIE